MLIPICKVDEERRLVIGRAAQEVPDRSGEIMDYATAKPQFQKWSDETMAASGGKSLGNVRAMHGNIAAGKLEAISFDDDAKSIEVVAKIVDDNEWAKVLEGVYTGFSMGGKYLKRWQDGDLTRYTPGPLELSIVDRPCIPTAQFADIVKADGSTGQILLKGSHMENDETAGVAAAAEDHASVEAAAKAAPLETLRKYLGEEVWDATRAIDALETLTSLLRDELWEAEDGKPEPDEQITALRDAIARIKAFIVSEIQENNDEGAEEAGEEAGEASDSVMAQADGGGDLTKAAAAAPEPAPEPLRVIFDALCKLGFSVDGAVAAKADSGGELAKAAGNLAKVQGELDDLRKSHDAIVAECDGLRKEKAAWDAAPAPAKGALRAVTKADDAGQTDPVAELNKSMAGMTDEQKAAAIIKFQMKHGVGAFKVA